MAGCANYFAPSRDQPTPIYCKRFFRASAYESLGRSAAGHFKLKRPAAYRYIAGLDLRPQKDPCGALSKTAAR